MADAAAGGAPDDRPAHRLGRLPCACGPSVAPPGRCPPEFARPACPPCALSGVCHPNFATVMSVIPGLSVGHVTDNRGLTGCTVIMPDRPATGALEIAGRAAAVHGLEFLDPRHLVPTVDGVVLAGGSAFGLEAIWGVMQWLEERGVGFQMRHAVVPHVSGAIVSSLAFGDPRARPDRAMGSSSAVVTRPGPIA